MNNALYKFSLLLFLVSVLGITGCKTTYGNAQGVAINPEGSEVVPDIASDQDKSALDKNVPFKQTGSTITTSRRVQTGRYSAIQPVPTDSQRELLQVMITVTIPEDMQTIGQTIRYLLKRSGYRMVEPTTEQKELTALLLKPLPEVHRRLGPMTLHHALVILTAPVFTLVEDPVHRQISYQLDKQYRLGAML